MYTDLLIVLLPLFIGYLIPLSHQPLLRLINTLLGWMVYVILFLMGISLAFLENLSANLILILKYTSVTAVCILALNFLALLLLEKRFPWRTAHKQEVLPSRLNMVVDSLKLCGIVIAGFLIGLTEWSFLHHATKMSELALILLLALVGIQLRSSGMTLRQIALNWRGMLIAIVVCISALIGGAVAAQLLGLPLKTGLALASSYGWYSLSGIVLTESFGPVIGSTAFFNDLIRELVAIMLIPALARKGRSVALGLCGATSMDFTLPILQRSTGVEIVPAAIVHGFILSLAAPILMAFLSS